MNGFGECPRCGKIGLVIVRKNEYEDCWGKYISSIEVKRIHCGYSATIWL